MDTATLPSFLSAEDLAEIAQWRRKLHTMPELSGEERETAAEVVRFLAATAPADEVVTGLGGHGVAAIYNGTEAGPTILFRSELDALPIQEISEAPHRSRVDGKAHLCGHEGHTATLTALARGLHRQRPRRGRVVLMFQPAEEDGSGAAAVVRDPRFAAIAPDMAFSFHNMPGVPVGVAQLRTGVVSCASRGMRIALAGKTAHASMPETGVSPMQAISALMPALTALGSGTGLTPDFALVTITHCRMGEPAFGVAPADAQIWATLRTLTDDRMGALVARAEELATRAAAEHKLALSISYHDVFAHVENAAEAVAHLARALAAEGVAVTQEGLPMRPSEDFGRFGQKAPAAMFFLGAGESYPSLHNPDYDFPDAQTEVAARVFMRVAREILG